MTHCGYYGDVTSWVGNIALRARYSRPSHPLGYNSDVIAAPTLLIRVRLVYHVQ